MIDVEDPKESGEATPKKTLCREDSGHRVEHSVKARREEHDDCKRDRVIRSWKREGGGSRLSFD